MWVFADSEPDILVITLLQELLLFFLRIFVDNTVVCAYDFFDEVCVENFVGGSRFEAW